MAAENRKSAERTIGLVDCPACCGVGGACTVCSGGRKVTVDVAVAWTIEHGSQSSMRPPPPPSSGDKSTSYEGEAADALLLGAIATVLEKLDTVTNQGGARALAERALDLRRIILGWKTCVPSVAERNEVTSKVLGLHVALSRLLTHDETK